MTDTELYEIVKGHREAWPEGLMYDANAIWGEWVWYQDGPSRHGVLHDTARLALEASFHRALLAKTDVYATPSHGGYTVQVRDLDFEAPTLIEAYAMVLEWFK
jgi:hypothetical protein